MSVLGPLAWLRGLLGERRAILALASAPAAFPAGLFFALSAGFAREYDGEYLVREPWHVPIPALASALAATLFWLAFFRPWRGGAPSWRSFVGLFWMSAPLAWLYAIPYERFAEPLAAFHANLWTLALVSVYRVAWMTRVLSVLRRVPPLPTFFGVLLIADLAVMGFAWLAPKSVLIIMGGVRGSELEAAIGDTNLGLFVFSSLALPVLLIAAAVARAFRRAETELAPAVPGPGARPAGRAPCSRGVSALMRAPVPSRVRRVPWHSTFAAVLSLAQQSAQDAPVAMLTSAGVELLLDGERRALAGSAGAETLAWDRDGEHVLITRGGRLERLPLAGGEVEVLAQGWRSVRMPDVAPDGARVVFAATKADDPGEGWEVVLLERASGATRVLCAGYDPCFARDGASVLCERYPERDLWRVGLDGGALARVFATHADRYTVQADPFAERLAFSSEGRLALRELESGAELVLGPPDAYDRFASFAPDRRHVLFFREQGAFRGIRERDLVSGAERTLCEGGVELAAYAPPTLARFEALSRAARAGRAPAEWLPVDARVDPDLRRWLEREASESEGVHLFLSGVTALAPAEAAALRGFGGRALFLPDLASLDPASAALLAEFRGSLYLDGLARLDPATARALAAWRGNGEQLYLSLDGLRDAGPEALSALGACRGWGLSLGGLATLPPEAARALGPVHVARLDLDGLEHVDRATAEAISGWHAKFLGLRGWRARDAELVALVERGCAALLTE